MDVERCQAIYNEKWFSIPKIHSFKSRYDYSGFIENRVCRCDDGYVLILNFFLHDMNIMVIEMLL